MKLFRNKNILTYLFQAELLLLLSMGLAFGICSFFQLTAEPEKSHHSITRSRYLSSNYRTLLLFLNLKPDSASRSELPTNNTSQLIDDFKQLEIIETAMTEGNYTAVPALLKKISDTYGYFSLKKEYIRLQYLYRQKQYQYFLKKYQEFPFEDVGMRQMFFTSLVKTGNSDEAFEVFRELFKRQKISALSKIVPPALFQTYVKKLNFDDWFEKYDYLLDKRRYQEFLQEQRYCQIEQLNYFFNGEYNYRRKSYTRALYWLGKVTLEKLAPHKQRIETKINIRQDIYNPETFLTDIRSIPSDANFYPQFLLNIASLMVIKGEYPLALGIYDEFIKLGRTGDDEHWKAMWRSAWINIKENNRTRAFSFFHTGRQAPIDAYKIANDYWYNRMSDHQQSVILQFPFSFYFSRAWQETPPASYTLSRDALESFVELVNEETTPGFKGLILELENLLKAGMIKEAHSFVKWTQKSESLNQTDRNLLKIIDSIIHLKEGRLQNAFVSFRQHFPQYQRILLPRFLRALYLPLRYEELIHRYCREQDIDPYLVMALIREESYFRKDAVSHANAYGLMQLLLGTARTMARPFNIRLNRKDLFEPETNIRLGCIYFRKLIDRYNGKVHMALAAYNAGENRVDRWRTEFWYAEDDDEFIEMIPFTETRNYVKNILRNHFYYRYYYNNIKQVSH